MYIVWLYIWLNIASEQGSRPKKKKQSLFNFSVDACDQLVSKTLLKPVY